MSKVKVKIRPSQRTIDNSIKSNALTLFFPLKPFSERIDHPEQSATAILGKLQAAVSSIQDAFVIAIGIA
ncbi:MAG TPA: hypothetical protein VGF37_09630 [Chthoniobacterales bacterium]|jgi:hypothetical protein